MSVHLLGRLGNQLFQAASSFGIAVSRGAQWCLTDLEDSALQKSVNFLVQPVSCDSEDFRMADEHGKFSEFQEWMMRGPESVRVATHLQSYRYFAASGLPFELRTAAFGRRWVAERGVGLGIHVRRTDQLTEDHGGKDPGVGYFEAALRLLRSRTGAALPAAVVCTDDVPWVRAQAVFDGMHVRNGAQEAAEEVPRPPCFPRRGRGLVTPRAGHGHPRRVQAHGHVDWHLWVVGGLPARARRLHLLLPDAARAAVHNQLRRPLPRALDAGLRCRHCAVSNRRRGPAAARRSPASPPGR